MSRLCPVPCLAGAALVAALLPPAPARACAADVVAARAHCTPASVCRFDVTIHHADAGWDHYADRYEILGPGGEVLATRVLRHPHVDEQPFTRSLLNVHVPPELTEVTVRAHDSVHGYGGAELTIPLRR